MEFSYLDNSATTPICGASLKKMSDAASRFFGNPSSLHNLGMEAEKEISSARNAIFASMRAEKYGKTKPQMLVFTASGTEANNLALIGVSSAKERRRGGKIIVGETEHPSVIESAKYLVRHGFRVSYIPSPGGVWDMERYLSELTDDTFLVSAMLVNNETGAINDIKAISDAAKAKNPDIIVHCDAVQGFLKTAEPLASNPADIITVSSHKIGGPKGVGALFIREKILTSKGIVPIIHGGGQESGMRSGTENTIGIIGFGAAAAYSAPLVPQALEKFKKLRLLAEKILSEKAPDIKINTPRSRHTDHIMSLTLPSVRSETMLHFLSSRGIYVSSGSACSSNTGHKSHVLLSYGLSENEVDSTIRVSFGIQNNEEDIERLCDALSDGISSLCRRTR